jgi:hypothetical protein
VTTAPAYDTDYRAEPRPDWWPEPQPIDAADLSARYCSPFSVREKDGSLRLLSMCELLAVVRHEERGPVERYEREGCCGCRGTRGDCESQPVALRLRTERGNRGMGTRSLGWVGGLCPLSEWWIAYDATRDAAAVAEARFSGELAE